MEEWKKTKNGKGWFRWLLIIGLLVLSVVMLSACIQKQEAAIIGKWQEVGGTETVEFFKDGTVTFVENRMTMSGNYKFIDDDRIRIELGGFGAIAGPMIFKVSISKDKLTLTSPDGKVYNYQRATYQDRTVEKAPTSTRAIKVPADVLWYNTGIWVEKGQKITFEASGSVSGSCIKTDGAYKFVGPDGWSYEPSFNRKRQLLVPDAPFMSLVGAIEIGGKGFLVGSSRTIVAPNSGAIYLASNDAYIDEYGIERPEWWNCNPGHYTVKIGIQ